MAQLLNLASALEMLGGEKNLLKELLTDFACGKQFKKEELVRLEQMEDKTEAAKYVHYFKGAARQIGAEQFAATAQKLEDTLRGRENGDLEALNEAFEQDLKAANAAINLALKAM
ncbi:MAG: Hpt domain-containing protein [Treponema sp.]|jgi:HPt (histidine-containing phosphotransfer) domain-containing protein|nr:Hpt domain-containing protein [Treponema sp.]